MMRRMALLAAAAMLLACFGALAEFGGDFNEDIFGSAASEGGAFLEDEIAADDAAEVTFDEGGYTGAWTSVEDIEIEFFLPNGWTADGADEEEDDFFAESADGAVQLTVDVYEEEYDGAELSEWAQANLEGEYEMAVANSQDVVMVVDDSIGQVQVLVPDAGRIISFNFFRNSPEAISNEFALEIAGTCTDLWL